MYIKLLVYYFKFKYLYLYFHHEFIIAYRFTAQYYDQ